MTPLIISPHSRKNLTRCWKKGEKVFPSIYGVKAQFAYELIFMGDIPVDDKNAALKNAVKYLESQGWKWEKYHE